ncbi:MAG: DUF2723 domain-containing protein [Anaerolineae bacterium]|nr:DUF2723 domain-containing protein [Anaerolineae bacterium]
MEDWKVAGLEDRKVTHPQEAFASGQPSAQRLESWILFSRFRSFNLLTLQSSLISGTLFIASLILYISTLAPSVVTIFDDSLEFQLVTYQLGIAHPTGYPLYTLLGKLFTFIPAGDVAYRVNLMSAFFGAATVALLYLVVVRLSAGRMEEWKKGGVEEIPPSSLPACRPSLFTHLGGIVGAVLFAVSPVFWQQATIAEVYTLNAFFVGILLLLTLTLPLKGESRGGVLWLAFFAGLALTHHRTILLLFPALVLYLTLNQKPGWRQPDFFKTLMLSLFLGLSPLLLYLYLPVRGHVGSLDGTYQNTWTGFWQQVSAGGYGTFIFSNPFGQEHGLAFYGRLFQNQFYTVLPGVAGLFYLIWQERKFLVLTAVAFLTYTAFNFFYRVSDIEVFFIPPFLLWAAWSGVGAAFLGQIVARMAGGQGVTVNGQQSMVSSQRSASNIQRLALAATALILIVSTFIIFQLFQTNLPVLEARNTWQVHDYGLDILQQPLPEHAAIVGILGEMTLLRYFQQTENRRPDLKTIAADIEAERLVVVEKLLAEGKAVYLTRELPGAAERWSLGAVGPLIRVYPQAVAEPAQMDVTINQRVTPEISLLGYDTSRPPQTDPGPAPMRLTLFWQAIAPVTTSLKVSARLLDPAGETVAAVDAIPLHFAYPTPAWRPGEIVADVYDLSLPENAPPGSYTPLLIWYDPAQNVAEVGRIELEPLVIQ